ncbi:MAG TPA: glycoside hydrolase family 2 TIM barrel-domain containing protein [Phototrophicaceae bacterium]|nr:glycoside hydrolase family 2 TIM barrel-domain containing protein [Phototrophicaceae bacterium]
MNQQLDYPDMIVTSAYRLHGDWQVCPVPLATPDSAEIPGGNWLTVPECAHLQPTLYPDRPYWGDHLRPMNHQAWLYQRTFTVSADAAYQRARLRFEGVDYYASVWLNGQPIGQHEGHFAPFEFDVTAALRPGENHLLVRVWSPWDAPNPNGSYPIDHVLRGLVKGLYEHAEGVIPPDVNPIGIWRPTWLVLDTGISVDRARIRTELDGTVHVNLTVTNTTPTLWRGTLDLAVAADNHAGPGVQDRLDMSLAPGTHTLEYTLCVPEPRLWWSWDQGEAHLYRLKAALRDEAGAIVSAHAETFGIRTVRLERAPEKFTYFLNERPVYLRGSSYMPGLYLSLADRDALARDVTLAREANLNLLRVHVHVSPAELYDLCDRAGIMIWQDSELNWVHDPSVEFEARALKLQRELIDLLGNHPSVMIWACHNEPTMVFARRENLEQHPDPALYADAFRQDPTRPVFICSGQMESDWQRAGDLHSYYGAIHSGRYTDIYRYSPRLSTEFGFEAPAALETLRRHPEAWERLGHLEGQIDELWNYQAELTQFHVEHFRRLRATTCTGYVHFWLNDLAPQVGCGVLDVERRPKGGYAALKRASQPLLPMLEYDGKQPRGLWVCNDTPRNYPNARLQWRILDANQQPVLEGDHHFDLSANAVQRISAVVWKIELTRCAEIEMTLTDANGSILAENYYAHPFQPSPRPRGYPWKFDPYLGCKVFDHPNAISLADHNIHPIIKIVPLTMRENIAEWALRQRMPVWFLSATARLTRRFMG